MKTTTETTHKDETTRRKEHVKNAISNSALEGLKPSPATRADMEEYIQGKITPEEGIKRLKARHAIH